MKAKVLTPAELDQALAGLSLDDRALLLVSHKAALRSCELAALDWSMLTTASGELSDSIDLPAIASKGRTGAGRLPLSSETLRSTLLSLWIERHCPRSGAVFGKPGHGTVNAEALARRIGRIYDRAGLKGATSHSGRRTALTTLIRSGMNLADAKKFARHADEKTTLRYCDASDSDIICAAVGALG
ncbi:MAG TPA: site-specific integrase [Stellaceae bacterium]|nr:site-specific integrase [Stellaceae bacterium]